MITTFDIYDTAIFRKTLTPRGIFKLVEQKVGNNFEEKRVEAEFKVRLEKDFHTLEEVYELLPEFDINVELETELENSYANPDILYIYNGLNECERYFISDMYLTAEQLKPILEHCGYKNPKIFSSIDFHKSKSRGDLYQAVMDKIGQIYTHYGDNYKSDIVNARKSGIINTYFKSALHKYKAWTPKLKNNPILSRQLVECERNEKDLDSKSYFLILLSSLYKHGMTSECHSEYCDILHKIYEKANTAYRMADMETFDMSDTDYLTLIEKFVNEPYNGFWCRLICDLDKYDITEGRLFEKYEKCFWKQGFLEAIKSFGLEYSYLTSYFELPSYEKILNNRNTNTLLKYLSEGNEPIGLVGDIFLINKFTDKYPELKLHATIIDISLQDNLTDLEFCSKIYTVGRNQDDIKLIILNRTDISEDRIKRVYK